MDTNKPPELATKDYVRAEVSQVEVSVAKGFGEANNVIAGIRTEIAEGFGKQNADLEKRSKNHTIFTIITILAVAGIIVAIMLGS